MRAEQVEREAVEKIRAVEQRQEEMQEKARLAE